MGQSSNTDTSVSRQFASYANRVRHMENIQIE
jgi:hypothetical protein